MCRIYFNIFTLERKNTSNARTVPNRQGRPLGPCRGWLGHSRHPVAVVAMVMQAGDAGWELSPRAGEMARITRKHKFTADSERAPTSS